MAAALPAGLAGVLGSIGISAAGALARSLAGAAQPLFVVSAFLLIAGALGCSRIVAVLAVGGSVLLYLSMFELAGGDRGSMTMTAMRHGQSAARAASLTFYAGLAALLLSIALQIVRRRCGTCRPVLHLRRGV